MKINWTLLLILLFGLVGMAYAQDNLPDTATGAVAIAAGILAGVASLAGLVVVEWIKKLPFLTGPDKEEVGGSAALLITGIITVLSGHLISWLTPYATYLDESGIWPVIIVRFGPWVIAELRYRLKKRE